MWSEHVTFPLAIQSFAVLLISSIHSSHTYLSLCELGLLL